MPWCPGKYRMISLTRTSQSPVKAEHGRSKYWEVPTGANSPLLSPLPRLSWSLMESDDDVSGEEEGQYKLQSSPLSDCPPNLEEISQIIEVQSTVGRPRLQQQALARKAGGSSSDLTSHLSPSHLAWLGK